MLTIRRQWVLRGPNLWAHFPVIELLLDLGEIKDSSSDEIPGFNDRLKTWLPSLIEHRCSVGERGGFFQRLDRGTYMAHCLEHVALELQTLAGTPVGYGRARETDEDGVYKVAIRYEEEALGLAAIAVARDLLLAAIQDQPFDVVAAKTHLRDLCHEVRLGPSTTAIARAARARRIPVQRLGTENLLQLGWGRRQRRAWTAETDRTSAIAESIAQDKDLTRMLLHAVGVPVPVGRPVANAEEAWAFAQELGAPVVVKPRYGNHGRGVTVNLTTPEQITRAFATAREEGSSILCERYLSGADHRLLVVGDRLVAAAIREPAQVVGDGHSSVRELVALTNQDPRRSAGHSTVLSLIELDGIALTCLADQGMTLDTVPAAGQRVLLRRNANLSSGGTATDVTDRVHPAVAARALEAARMVGLDLAGIDVLAEDIGRPLEEQGGGVVEVNAGPGLRMHLEPSAGQSRPVGEAIVELLFPADSDGRIPVVAVTGNDGTPQTVRLITRLLGSHLGVLGEADQDGIRVAGRCIDPRDGAGPEAARTLLMNPSLDAAILALAIAPIRSAGLGFDRCQVGVVMGVGETVPAAHPGIETLEDLVKVERCIVEAVSPGGWTVLNAEDARVAAMAEVAPGPVLWFARDRQHPLIDAHLARGGRAVLEQDGIIRLVSGPETELLWPLARGPALSPDAVDLGIRCLLAAIATAWAMDLPPERIGAGLASVADLLIDLKRKHLSA